MGNKCGGRNANGKWKITIIDLVFIVKNNNKIMAINYVLMLLFVDMFFENNIQRNRLVTRNYLLVTT
jgi:hypothetical protein